MSDEPGDELDTRIRAWCAERGLDHDSASDYAAAAIAGFRQ